MDSEIKFESIPKWITVYGFFFIMSLFIFIPVILFNFDYTFTLYGITRDCIKDKEKTFVSIEIQHRDSSRIKMKQRVICSINNKRYLGKVIKTPYFDNKKNILLFEIRLLNVEENSLNKVLQKNTIIINDGKLFNKIFNTRYNF